MKPLLNMIIQKNNVFTFTSNDNNALYYTSDISFLVSFPKHSLELIYQKDLTISIGVSLKEIVIHNFTNNKAGAQNLLAKDIKLELHPTMASLTKSKTHLILLSYNFGSGILSKFVPSKTTEKITLDNFHLTYRHTKFPSYTEFPFKKYIIATLGKESFL
jgi:hypothetical protein